MRLSHDEARVGKIEHAHPKKKSRVQQHVNGWTVSQAR